jgi:UMF1 family MFS transporter
MFFVPEPHTVRTAAGSVARDGMRQVMKTLKRLRDQKPIWMFLLAYWFYIDGVDTVVRMAVDYGKSLHFDNSVLMIALLITQVIGFPAALIYAWLGPRIGTKRAILVGLGVYLLVILWGTVMRSPAEFYGLAVMIGLIQGGIQALSRSLYSRLIPAGEAAEFFGFYNMLGKSAAFIGPTMMAIIKSATGSARVSMLSLIILFLIGGLLLTYVQEQEQRALRASG